MKLHPFVLPLLAAVALPATAFAAAPPAPGMPMSNVPGGKNITCAAFLRLSGSAATNVLYFVDGYAAGIEDQVSAGTPGPAGATDAAGGPSPSAAPASPSNVPASAQAENLSNLTGVTMDEIKALCRAQPKASVLSTIPGGQPVTGSGTLTGSSATGAPAEGAAGAAAPGTATNPATSGGGNTGATFGTSAAGATTGAAAAPGAASTPATPNTVTVPTPPTGTVTTDPATGLSTANPGGAGASPAGAGTTTAP